MKKYNSFKLLAFISVIFFFTEARSQGEGGGWLHPETDNAFAYHIGSGFCFGIGEDINTKILNINSGLVFYLGSKQPRGGWFGLGVQYINKARFKRSDSIISVPAIDGTIELAIPNHKSILLSGTAIIFAAGVPLAERRECAGHGYVGFRFNLNAPSFYDWFGDILTCGVYAEGGGSALWMHDGSTLVTADFRFGLILQVPWREK